MRQIGLNWVAVHGNDHLLFLFVTRGGWPASWIYAMCFVCSLQASGSINAVALGLNAVQANIYCINPSAPPMLTQGSCLQLHRGFYLPTCASHPHAVQFMRMYATVPASVAVDILPYVHKSFKDRATPLRKEAGTHGPGQAPI
eukprot:scaffold248939_cov18-Tisochrysis_lutea.AAC.1